MGHLFSRFGIELKDYEIFLRLQQNPYLSAHAISKNLGMVSQDVRDRISKMKFSGFLRTDKQLLDPICNQVQQTELEGVFHPSEIGLNRTNLILHNIRSIRNLRIIEAFCEIYPSTHYRVNLLDHQLSVFVQFDLTPQTEIYLKRILNYLDERDLFESYSMFSSFATVQSNLNLSQWQTQRDEWDLISEGDKDSNLFSSLSKIEFYFQQWLENKENYELDVSFPQSDVSFSQFDAILLREITINGKVKIGQLANKYDKDRSTISRRINRIRQKIAPVNQLYFDSSAFKLATSMLYFGKFDDNDDLNMINLNSLLKSSAIPFQSNAVLNHDSFLWHIFVPANLIPDFTYFIWNHTETYQPYQIPLSTAKTYYFNSNMRKNRNSWKEDKDFNYTIPLELLEKII